MIAELAPRARKCSVISAESLVISDQCSVAKCSDYELLFAVVTKTSGRVEMRHFASPRDAEGRTIRLTPRVRELLCHALATPGFHAIARDDDPELQLELFSKVEGGEAS